ncbi:MAG: O-methyltransferase [Alphaproteobacteria bacterium]|nr:O-methyltransferase [Alphaproteobacteria bacterium]
MRPVVQSQKSAYVSELFAREDTLLKSIVTTLREQDRAIQIGPEEGKLLQLLIALRGVRTVVEIGTLAGYSAIWMGRALPKDGHIHTIEANPFHAQWAKENIMAAGLIDQVTVHVGQALDILPTLRDEGPFDMAFIDADKIHYCDYLDWAETHVYQGGLIVADNTFLFDSVYEKTPTENVRQTTWEVMRHFNQRIADPEKYIGTILPTVEGMTVGIKMF